MVQWTGKHCRSAFFVGKDLEELWHYWSEYQPWSGQI